MTDDNYDLYIIKLQLQMIHPVQIANGDSTR